MSQLSRPYQIALVTMALFVAVWFLTLRGRTATSEQSPSVSPVVASAPVAAAQAKTAATPTPVHSGTAPGVAGLTRAINKAHGAVATSQANAKQLEEKSAQASSTSAPATATTAPSGATVKRRPATHGKTTHAATSAPAVAKAAPVVRHRSAAKALGPQASVEAQLKRGKLVAILFWNSKGTVDGTVNRELAQAARSLGGKLAVHVASAGEVGAFGSITRDVQVNQTPTILLITKTGSTMVLNGLTDAYAIEQAVAELRA